MRTSTEVTIEHYQRAEVREIIMQFCRYDAAWRPLNGDECWYKPGEEEQTIKLTSPEDYDRLIEKHRTLYATLDLLEPIVKEMVEDWNEKKGAPENPIGTFRNCLAFTPSVDIDSIKGPNGEDIIVSPELGRAVEDAGQFFIDYLKEHGISRSVHCLYTGGGIYIHVHHALFRAKTEWSPEERDLAFRSLCMAFNAMIGHVSTMFFDKHPEHKNRVKFDALNNQKRKFKCIFSIHKRLPFAVVPLNPEHIEIDFDKAKLPLSSYTLAEGREWYREYDLSELPKLKDLLKPYVENAKSELEDRKTRSGSFEIYRSSEPVPSDKFPPCIKNIIEKAEPGRGPHRALAVLAAYLYQAGWSEHNSFELWKGAADRLGVEPRIFDCWYGQMSCPNCSTIQKTSSGYPKVGLGGLGYCQPTERCSGISWPGNYGMNQGKPTGETETGEGAPTEKQAKVLARLVSEEAELFKDDVGQPYARIKVGSHFEVWPIDSKHFKLWLVNTYHSAKDDIPGSDSISRALMLIESNAYFNGTERRLDLRVAEHEGSFWYDLADDHWRAIETTDKGWKIIENPPPIFKRYGNTTAQGMPAEKGDLRQILEFINISNHQDQELFLIYLMTCFVPGISHPILPVHGEKGAAKTTTQKIIRRLVDPAKQELMTMPTRQDELALQMAQNYMPTYDNMSKLSDWQSDMLCTACTGGGISKRRLYSDTDEIFLSFKRCIGLNGINLVADKPDLLDRAILFELERVPEESRREEKEFWDAFDGARPSILAGIFDTLSKAMSIYPHVKLSRLPRMADFCRWGYAVAEATDLGGDKFLQIYTANIQAGNQEAVQNSSVASAVITFMAGQTSWEGSVAELLRELDRTAASENIETKGRTWPKAPNALSKRLKQVKNNLSQLGIEYSQKRDVQNRSLIRLEAGGIGRRSGDDSKRSPDDRDIAGYRSRRSGGSGDNFGAFQEKCQDESSLQDRYHGENSMVEVSNAQQSPKNTSGISGSPETISEEMVISGDNPEIMHITQEISPVYRLVRFLADVPGFEAGQFKHPQMIVTYGPFRKEDVASLPPEKAVELMAQNLAKEVKDDLTRCIVCQTEIGPGHGSYGGRYCVYCGPALKAIEGVVDDFEAKGQDLTQVAVYEHLRAAGRAPRIELIPILLRCAGIAASSRPECIQIEGSG